MSSGAIDGIRRILAHERLVVIDKPAGVLSVPGKGEANQACAASWVAAKFPGASGPLTVHRLDMDTSGLMVFALDAQAQRELSRQFEERTVEKRYVALVQGVLPRAGGESGEINLPMRLDVPNRPRQIIDHAQGRPAVTAWRILDRSTDSTRLELEPRTGRTHQLRLHLAAIDHPIRGDPLYGDPTTAPRLMLHATRLVFTEPGTQRRITTDSPPPF